MISKLLEKWLQRNNRRLSRRFHRILRELYPSDEERATALFAEGMQLLEKVEWNSGNLLDVVFMYPDDEEEGYHIEIENKIEVESEN